MTDKKTAPQAPQAPKTQVATYEGGMEGVVVSLPSGRILTFARGGSHELLASEHSALETHPEFKLADKAEGETQ
jgi:hypothetical protein